MVFVTVGLQEIINQKIFFKPKDLRDDSVLCISKKFKSYKFKLFFFVSIELRNTFQLSADNFLYFFGRAENFNCFWWFLSASVIHSSIIIFVPLFSEMN